MALQFVLGSSGSGKTEYIYERLVRQAGENYTGIHSESEEAISGISTGAVYDADPAETGGTCTESCNYEH